MKHKPPPVEFSRSNYFIIGAHLRFYNETKGGTKGGTPNKSYLHSAKLKEVYIKIKLQFEADILNF